MIELTYSQFDSFLLNHARNLSGLRGENPPADLLAPPVPEPEPAPRGGPRRILCDFCKCQLGADGGVLKTSTEAREMETASRTITDLRSQLQTAKGEADSLRQQLAVNNPAPAPIEPGRTQNKARPLSSYLSRSTQ